GDPNGATSTPLIPPRTVNERAVPRQLPSTPSISMTCGVHFLYYLSKPRKSSHFSVPSPSFFEENEGSTARLPGEFSSTLILESLCNGGRPILQTNSIIYSTYVFLFSGKLAIHCTARPPNPRFPQKFEGCERRNGPVSGHEAKKWGETRGQVA